MNREDLISLVTYSNYENDREDIANLCDAANKISIAVSTKPLCEGNFNDFIETIDEMVDENKISDDDKNDLVIKTTVPISEATPRELHFINKVRPTNIQDCVEGE